MLEYIILGVITGVAALVAAIILIWRRYSRRKSADNSKELHNTLNTNSYISNTDTFDQYPSDFVKYIKDEKNFTIIKWNELDMDKKNEYYKDWQFTNIYYSVNEYKLILQDIETWKNMTLEDKDSMIKYWSKIKTDIFKKLTNNYLISTNIEIKDLNNKIPNQYANKLKNVRLLAYEWNMINDDKKNYMFKMWQSNTIKEKNHELNDSAKNEISLMDWYNIKKNKDRETEDKYVKLWTINNI